MASKITDEEAMGHAAESFADAAPPREPVDIDARLEELKRRMRER
jgi:hypothetical protein